MWINAARADFTHFFTEKRISVAEMSESYVKNTNQTFKWSGNRILFIVEAIKYDRLVFSFVYTAQLSRYPLIT